MSIKKLKYTTASGSVMELSGVPTHIGIELLFISLTQDEKREMIKTLTEIIEKGDDNA